jgi:hypothetical protein
MILIQDEAQNLFAAAKLHPIMGSTEIFWMGCNSFTGMAEGIVPSGNLGLGPYHANEVATQHIKSIWYNADPNIYSDYDGDRSTFAGFTLFASDAVVALSMAFEETIRAGLEVFNEIIIVV